MGAAVVVTVAALDGGSNGDKAGAASPGLPPTAPGPPPPPVRSSVPPPASPAQPNVGPGFFAHTVLTSRGAYRASGRWTRSCLKDAKPKLAALLRRRPCRGVLQGAMYRSPDRRVYVQMTAMRFASPADAARMSQAISSDAAPRIHVPYGNEPAHWWSASHAGNHVLIRQSFVHRSRKPGERDGPAQTYGDTLIRRFQAILAGLYTIRQQ